MKPIISFLLLLCATALYAQEYQDICAPGSTFFRGPTPNLHEYHYDSVKVFGQDSVFYSFYTIHLPGYMGDCADTMLGPVLSRIVRKKPSGWFVFLDLNADSIRFNTQAVLNEIFTCKSLPGNRRVEGKVIDIREDSVVDTVDQVKEIQFMARNQDGTVYPHLINGTTVTLSQHFGFSSTIDFNKFPNDTVHYTLTGKDSPPLGLRSFTWREVYDFEPGDEFHHSGCIFGTNGGPPYKYIDRILEKTWYGNYDSVGYLIERCTKWYYPGFEDSHDTIMEVYSGMDYPTQAALSRASYEFCPNYPLWRAPEFTLHTDDFNGRPARMYHDNAFTFCTTPSCWEPTFEGTHHYFEYAPGLGRTYYSWVVWDIITERAYDYLVYFKKGNETWGTPNAIDCSTLLGAGGKHPDAGTPVFIFPNPVQSVIHVTYSSPVTGPGSAFRLFNMEGRMVLRVLLQTENTEIQRHVLPSGPYFYRVENTDGTCISSGKLILE